MNTSQTGVIRAALKQIGLSILLAIFVFSSSISGAQAQVKRAYAGIVVDAKTGDTLYSHAANELRYPASVTKVMTLYMLFRELKAGRMTLNTKLKVSKYAASAEPTKLHVRAGSTIKVEHAIKALVTLSANDVARVIAENIGGTEGKFADQMTAMARALGMNKTTYANASGLPNRRQVTTVADQAKLGMAMYQHFPQYYHYFKTRSFTYGKKTYNNHNKLLGKNGVDGMKTGWIRASGYNLLTSARKNDRHIVVVGFGFSSGSSRNAKVGELVGKYISRSKRGDYWAQAKIRYPGGSGLFAGNVFAVAQDTPIQPLPLPAHRQNLVAPAALQNAPIAVASLNPDQSNSALSAPVPLDSLRTQPNNSADGNGLAPAPLDLFDQQGSLASAYAPTQQAPIPAARPIDIIGNWLTEGISNVVNGQSAQPLPSGLATLAPPADVGSATFSANGIDPNFSGSVPLQTTEQRLNSGTPQSWVVQVGAAPNENAASRLLSEATTRLTDLRDYRAYIEKFENIGQTYFRARYSGFADQQQAVAMCNRIKEKNMSCLAVQG